MESTFDPNKNVDPQPGESVWGPKYFALTLGLVMTIAGSGFEILAVAAIMPAAVRDLGGLALYGWGFSAFMLANLVGIVLGGDEADRHGPGRSFILGVMLFVGGLLLTGFSHTMGMFIAGRAVQGLGGGLISSSSYVCLGRGYPGPMRARMFAIISTSWMVPSLFGPGLAGIITDQVGWRWVFLGLVPFSFCSALITLPAMRKLSLQPTRGRDWPRTLASLALAGGSGLLLTGIGTGERAMALGLTVSGFGLVAYGFKRLMPEGTLAFRAGPPAAIALFTLASLAFFGVDSFVPLLMTAVRGQSATVAGLSVTAASMMWSTGTWLQIGLVKRLGRPRLVQLGAVMMMLSVGGVGALFWPSWPLVAGFIAWGLSGLGMGMIHAVMNLAVLETAAKGREGEASAAVQLAQMLGVAFGAGIGGAVLRQMSGGGQVSAQALGFQFALMILILLVVMATARRVPEPVTRGG